MRLLVTLAIALAFCATLSACGSSSPQSPRARIIAAALAQKSVHWTAEDYELVDHDIQISADVNADSGTARVSWNFGGDGGGEYRLVRVNGTFYVNGDSESLDWLFNLTNAQATRYAGRWISTPNRVGLTFGLGEGLTLSAIVREYASPARRRSPPATGEPLPSKFDQIPSQTEEISGSFSKWNEPLNIRAPANSTPIATVRAS